MPKQVDHDERRRHIARAVWEIAAGQGLEAVTVRLVARHAGISTPLVQHYFTDKDAMLRFAHRELAATAARRAEQRVAAVADPGSLGYVRTLLRATLAEYLPLDEERRTMLLVQIAFFSRALGDDELAAAYRDTSTELPDFFAGLLRDRQDAGELPVTLDPRLEIATLFTLATGLGTDLLLSRYTVDDAMALLDYHLDRLALPGG